MNIVSDMKGIDGKRSICGRTAAGADALFLYKQSVLLWKAAVVKLKNEGAERMIRISEQERPLPF